MVVISYVQIGDTSFGTLVKLILVVCFDTCGFDTCGFDTCGYLTVNELTRLIWGVGMVRVTALDHEPE